MTKAEAAAPLSFEDILGMATPREAEAKVCMDGKLAGEAERLIAELDVLDRQGGSKSLADGGARAQLASELDEVRERMLAAEVTFRFRAMPSREYSDLIAAHPGAPGRAVDAVSVQPHLISGSSLEPRMTLEQVNQLLDKINEGERDKLFAAAWKANNAETVIPSSRAASARPSLSDAR